MSDIFGPDDPSPDYPGGSEYPGFEDETIEATWGGRGIFVDESWFEPITIFGIEGDQFIEYTMPVGDWYEATLMDAEDLEELYGLDNIELIHMLESYGIWDADDWNLWRELYGEAA